MLTVSEIKKKKMMSSSSQVAINIKAFDWNLSAVE